MEDTQLLNPLFKYNGISLSRSEWLAFDLDKTDLAPFEIENILFIKEWLNSSDSVQAQTSGSTGTPKNIVLKKAHMLASAKATHQYFSLFEGAKVLLNLSTSFIAGKMMLVRALVNGYHLTAVEITNTPLQNQSTSFDFGAMVPTQVEQSLSQLHQISCLIIGGGVVAPPVQKALQAIPSKAYATYGMTETITHIAAQRLNGKQPDSMFHCLPGITVDLDKRKCLVINAPTISDHSVITNDVVKIYSDNSFEWLGRLDHVINSGGLKIHPEELESILSKYISSPFYITKMNHVSFGETPILVVENFSELMLKNINKANQLIDKPKRIKYIYIASFEYTHTGKLKKISRVDSEEAIKIN